MSSRAPPRSGVPAEPSRLYAIEANSHIAPPSATCPATATPRARAVLRARPARPAEPFLVEGQDVEVLVKRRTSAGIVGTRMTYATHPFDVVGWDGCL